MLEFKMKNSLKRTLLILWTFSPILLLFRAFTITISISSLNKHINPGLLLLSAIAAVIVLLEIADLKLKQFLKTYKIQLIIFGSLSLVNLISLIFSKYLSLGISMFAYLHISYLLGFATSIWARWLIKSKLKHKIIGLWIKAMFFIVAYGFLLSILQIYTVYKFRSGYKKLPLLFRKFVFNGYFIDKPLAQYLSYKHYILRPPGLLGDTNVYAMFLLIVLAISVILYLSPKLRENYSDWLAKIQILTISNYIFTFSRSALLGFIAVMAPLIVYGIVKKHTAVRAVIKSLALRTILTALFITGLILMTPVRSQVIKTTTRYVKSVFSVTRDASARTHVRLSSIAVKLALSHKLIPWGLGSFPMVYIEKIDPKAKFGASAHSLYATLIMEQGLPGFVVYVAILIYLWTLYIRQIKITINKPSADNAFTTALSLALPFLSVSTIFYFGFWDPLTWWWGIHQRKRRN